MIALEPGLLPSIDRRYRVFISALGFEERVTHAARQYHQWAETKIALAFPEEDRFHYRANKEYFSSRHFDIQPYPGDGWQSRCLLAHETGVARAPDGVFRDFCIDISSMSRPMIAEVLLLLRYLARSSERLVTATLLYSPACYVPPSVDEGPIVKSEPVVPEFAGWSAISGAPSVALIGLGYEPDFALGTWEYLEASSLVTFFPTGEDERYDVAVSDANEQLLSQIEESQVYRYRVDDPVRLFIVLDNLVSGIARSARPIIVPFGPKIFAVVALLVALRHYPAVTIWRVSGDQATPPIDRKASGKVIALDVSVAESALLSK